MYVCVVVHIPYIVCIVRVCVCAVYIPWHRWRLLLLPGWHLGIEFRLVSLKVLLPTEPSHEFRSVPFQTRLHHFSSRFSIPSVSYFESRVFCCTRETCCRPTNSPLSGHKHMNTQRDTWTELAIPLQQGGGALMMWKFLSRETSGRSKPGPTQGSISGFTFLLLHLPQAFLLGKSTLELRRFWM